jgi:hypothetical protein
MVNYTLSPRASHSHYLGKYWCNGVGNRKIQCWAVLTHRLKIGVGFQFGSQWELMMRTTIKTGLKVFTRCENCLGSHLAPNLRIGLVLTFWEGSSSLGKKLKNKKFKLKKTKVTIYEGDCHNKWGFNQVWLQDS